MAERSEAKTPGAARANAGWKRGQKETPVLSEPGLWSVGDVEHNGEQDGDHEHVECECHLVSFRFEGR